MLDVHFLQVTERAYQRFLNSQVLVPFYNWQQNSKENFLLRAQKSNPWNSFTGASEHEEGAEERCSVQGILVLERCSAGQNLTSKEEEQIHENQEENPVMSVPHFQLIKLHSAGRQKKYIQKNYFQKASSKS